MLRWQDTVQLATQSLVAGRLRSLLTMLGIAVGIAAVVIMTAFGEGLALGDKAGLKMSDILDVLTQGAIPAEIALML